MFEENYKLRREDHDMTDAVGDLIRIEKIRKSLRWQAKVIGWLIVVLAFVSLVLLFTKKAL